MSDPAVRLSITAGVATATIDRPAARNALNEEVRNGLRQTLAECGAREDVAALVITGAGEKSFAAGADISQLRRYTLRNGLDGPLQRLCDEIEAFGKLTIAAVNGWALGGGCELAMACDIRIAARSARFGQPETGLSILPGAGGTQRLSRLVGAGRALDLILTGRVVPAEEALAIGLVTRIANDEDLPREADQLAREIISRGPIAIRLAKLVVRAALDTDQRTGLAIERLAQALLFTTRDKREGAEAFLEKRQPKFSGE